MNERKQVLSVQFSRFDPTRVRWVILLKVSLKEKNEIIWPIE